MTHLTFESSINAASTNSYLFLIGKIGDAQLCPRLAGSYTEWDYSKSIYFQTGDDANALIEVVEKLQRIHHNSRTTKYLTKLNNLFSQYF